MSAWYVLCALGMYEVCPGSGIWLRTEPIFKNDLDWALASDPLGEPLCCPKEYRITPCPVFNDWRMQSTRDHVSDTSAQWEGRLPSQIVRHTEVRTSTDKHVTYLTQPAPQYTENGPEGMVDNIFASTNYRIGGWQGWQEDMVAVVELDQEQTVRHVALNCLENMRSWIFFPINVKMETSLDGKTWKTFGEVSTTQFPTEHYRQEESVTHTFCADGATRAKYVKITATNFGALPDWHVSAGQQAWLFADEIIIK